MNTVVGAGSLVTFPTLLAVGLDPITANVSNTVGLVGGSMSGAAAQGRELAGQRARIRALAPAAAVGGLTGAVLLLVLPSAVFDAVVPALVAMGCVLVLVQPWIRAALARRGGTAGDRRRLALLLGVFLAGVYGGYFGAAFGVIVIALLGALVSDTFQRLNATKNLLAAIVNGIAAVTFAIAAPVDWPVAVVIALSSILGGQVGARVARHIPETPFRIGVAVVGLIVAARLQFS